MQTEITVAAIHNSLINGRETERVAAQAALKGLTKTDRAALRLLISQSLKRDFYTGREDVDEDRGPMWTRSWMINTLCRITDGDAEAEKLIRQHLDAKYEKQVWVRYWALEGLVAADAADVVDLARQIRQAEEPPLIEMAAEAILASSGDEPALKHIKKCVDPNKEELSGTDLELQWAALRALRVVAIPATIKSICKIVNAGQYSDATYDAIVALGRMPKTARQAEDAVRALANFVAESRRSNLMEGMRIAALKALGNLGAESASTALLESLADDSPAIVREAAWALKKVLGVRTAAARVVEAASKAGNQLDSFSLALRWMDRDSMAEELEGLMTSGPADQQEVARKLLSEIGGAAAFQKLQARKTAMNQYISELEKAETTIRDLFETSIKEARSGFKSAIIMDFVVFSIGVALIVGSAVVAVSRGGDLNDWAGLSATGGLGVLGVLYGTLVAKPREKIKEAVDHLMQLKVIFLAYLRQLHQADQAYTRALLEGDELTVEDLGKFSLVIQRTMERATRALRWDTSSGTEPETLDHQQEEDTKDVGLLPTQTAKPIGAP